jgi:hypothetical protein
MKILHAALALLGIFLCGYGIHCAQHMHEYIGTGHYFSNVWFWKGHAALAGVIATYLAMGLIRDRSKDGKS